MIVPILVLCVIAILKRFTAFGKAAEKPSFGNTGLLCFSLLPAVLYFFLVAKIASDETDRYIFPIYTVLLSAVLSLLWISIQALLENKSLRLVLFSLVCAISLISQYSTASWPYLYLSETERLSRAGENKDLNAIIVYDEKYTIVQTFLQASQYNSVTFYSSEDLEQLQNYDYRNSDALICLIPSSAETDDLMERIVSFLPNISSFSKTDTFAYYTTWELS